MPLTTSICPAGQGSLTGKAIKDSWNQMFSAVPRGRKSKLVLLTDGPSNDDVKVPSKWIRDNGVELFVIGLGKGYDETQLRDMASLPSDKHIMFKDYDGLSASVQEVRNRVCGFNAKEGWSSLENYWTQNCNYHVQFSLSIKSFKFFGDSSCNQSAIQSASCGVKSRFRFGGFLKLSFMF